jgi:2-oxo-4-hydroxy-4-carboxy-5-ureidoimidazoline decarboxylase
MTLTEANALDLAGFRARFGGVFEHSPWVAERAWQRRPFVSADDLLQIMNDEVGKAGRKEQLALIRAHPELAGREAKKGALTASSTGEQARLGFLSLSSAEFQRMAELNRQYREKFGFPCIVALRLHQTRDSVMEEMARRAQNDPEAEVAAALEQIGHIARGRLEKLLPW